MIMSAAIFISLNILDAYLTKTALAMGAEELNPLVIPLGSSMVAKGLMAVALVLILYLFRKEGALWLLNFALFGLILWNLAIVAIAGLY